MTTPTNWPDPNRPGVPMFPDRDGKHIIDVDPEGAGSELVYYWKAKHQVWVEYDYEGPDDALEEYDLIGWAYVGPCLTHTQISELLAGERERCAGVFDQKARNLIECMKGTTSNLDSRQRAHDEAMIYAAAIRSLPDE